MTEIQDFDGFSKETVVFFNSLKENNNKPWFDSHKKDYGAYIMEPAKAFVVAMGERLRALSPNIMAIPKVNKSLFRINRDTRFSLDKSPYKTNLGIFLWEGARKRMECSGFYFHLEPPGLLLGVGIYMFPQYMLENYRHSVVHPKHGKELTNIMNRISKRKGYSVGGKHYKRVPAGYDSSHPNADLLLYNGLHVGTETSIPEEFYSYKLIDYCWEMFHPLAPLQKWLVSMTSRL